MRCCRSRFLALHRPARTASVPKHRQAAEQFAGQVEVVKLDAMGPEADAYGIMSTPLIVVGDEVVGRGKVIPAKRLAEIIAEKLGG